MAIYTTKHVNIYFILVNFSTRNVSQCIKTYEQQIENGNLGLLKRTDMVVFSNLC